jgi:hypothetical protein
MRLFITFSLFLSLGFVKAQADLYTELLSFISSKTGESVSERLVAVNVWSASDAASRHQNQELEKSCNTYAVAKLKGGNKGIIGIIFCIDKDEVSAMIALKKDGISKVLTATLQDHGLAEALKAKNTGYNIVFDKAGKMIYENLKEGQIFDSIHYLITR